MWRRGGKTTFTWIRTVAGTQYLPWIVFFILFYFLVDVFFVGGVALLTLLEHKVLGYIHICKDTNKVEVFFSHLEMLLSYFLESSIFL